MLRYHAVGALIGLDARAADRTPNGLGTYARSLIAALVARDSEHSWVIIRRPDTGPPMATGPHVREVFMRGDVSTPSFGRGISRLGLDLYHSLHHFLPVGLRVPHVVMTLHDLIWVEHRELIRGGRLGSITRHLTHAYAKRAMSAAMRRADRVIAISDHTRTRAMAHFGVDPSCIEVVHHGVAHERFRARHVGPPAEPPYFLCLGNSRPYKNMPVAIRAFALVARAQPDVRLLVTGRGDSTKELRALAKQLGVDRRVTFTGVVNDATLLDLLHGAVALVFPSLVEGFGLPVLEAMAAGCPVVTSNAPTLAEVTGSAAIHCDPRSPQAFANAMTGLLHDPASRERLRQRGILRAAEFTWSRCADRTLAVYGRLLGEAAPRRAAAR